MNEKASEPNAALESGQDVVSQTSEQLSQTARETSETVQRTASDMKDQAVRGMETSKDRTSQQIADTAESVHRSAEQFREHQQPWLADLVDRGAEQLDRLSAMMRGNDLTGLLNQLDSFARRQPALFAGASMIAGFALARMARVALDEGGSVSTASPVSGSSSVQSSNLGVP
jgi:2-succinyl-5-enolpyruvyl-6-hydroxy-3-cyclohexene-1-carboxylate synthase